MDGHIQEQKQKLGLDWEQFLAGEGCIWDPDAEMEQRQRLNGDLP